MVCREEHLTDSNGIAETTLLLGLRLDRIADVWEARCARKYNLWVAEFNRRITEQIAQDEATKAFDKRWDTYMKKCKQVAIRLTDLQKQFEADESSVTPVDWDAVVAGNESKVSAMLSREYPKETWPKSVPYPNLIALSLYCKTEEDLLKKYMRQYRAAMEDTAEIIAADKARFRADLVEMIIARLDGQPVLDKAWDMNSWVESTLEAVGIDATEEVKGRLVQQIRLVILEWRHHTELFDSVSDELDMTIGQDVTHEGEYILPHDF